MRFQTTVEVKMSTAAPPEQDYGYEPEPINNGDGNPDATPDEYFSGPDDDQFPSGTDAAGAPAPPSDATPPTPPPAEPPAPAAPALPPMSRADWADYGLSEAQARYFDEKGVLNEFLTQLDQQFIAMGTPQEPPPQSADPPAQPPPVPQAPPAPAPAQPPTVEDLLNLGFSKEEVDEYGEALGKRFGDLTTHLGQQAATIRQQAEALSAMENRLTEAMDFVQQERNRAFDAEMDEYFASLPPEYEAIFGKGSGRNLDPNGAEMAQRKEVARAFVGLRNHYGNARLPMPAGQALFTRARDAIVGAQMQELARRQVAADVEKTRGQFTHPPTHREGKPLSGVEAAAAYAENFFRSRGM